MAVVMPFRGVEYNPQRYPDLSPVVAPPYDIISPAERDLLYDRNPHNVIRLILGKSNPGDDDRDNPYSRAAAFLDRWRAEQVLVRHPAPAVYLYDLDYTNEEGEERTRRGLIAVVELEEFGPESGVRPHEKTFTSTKDERLRLTKACRTNLSPIWSIYADPQDDLGTALSTVRSDRPHASFTDDRKFRHTVWAVHDPALLRRVHEFFVGRTLYIADGHHRYETALNYRRYLRETTGKDLLGKAPSHVMMYLSAMESPGLTILPAHRLLARRPDHFSLDTFLDRAGRYFTVHTLAGNGSDRESTRMRLATELKEKGRERTTFGLAVAGENRFFLLQLKEDAPLDGALSGIEPQLRDLDVVVLSRVVLCSLLGLEEAALDDVESVRYNSSFTGALDEVARENAAAALLLNSTPVDQMKQVAEASLCMPRKSTYFYPKVISGLVFNPLDPEDAIILP